MRRRLSYLGCFSKPATQDPYDCLAFEPELSIEGTWKVTHSVLGGKGADGNTRDGIRNSIMYTTCGVSAALETMQTRFYQGEEEGDPRSLKKLKKLGQGGFGTVWLASTTGPEGEELVAVKELNEPIVFHRGCDRSLAQLKQAMPSMEAAIQSLMVHSNIVRTHWVDVKCVDPITFEPLDITFRDVMAHSPSHDDSSALTQADLKLDGGDDGLSGSTAWINVQELVNAEADGIPDTVGLNMRIGMDYCEYGALVDYLSYAGHPKPPLHQAVPHRTNKEVCAVMTARDISHALRLMHKNNILHLDLKPHNILLAADDTDPRGFIAKITDFGLSQRLQQGQAGIEGLKRGSPPYMSPEALSKGVATKKSDIYPFGILLWELWHGQLWVPLFNAEVRRRTPSGKRPNPQTIGYFRPQCSKNCPIQYSAIIDACLELEPSRRPDTLELKHLLDDAVADLSQKLASMMT